MPSADPNVPPETPQPTLPSRGAWLGVDVGSVRVGLAGCDPAGILATPIETLARDTSSHGRDLHRIAEEARAREAVGIVVGLPKSLSGGGGKAAQTATDYARRLARLVAPLPVVQVDERLTTVTAHQQLYGSRMAGRKHNRVVDQVAAVLILQTFLDARAGGHPGGTVLDVRS